MTGRKAATSGGGSTAAVLWLMILLVFLPIAAAHAVAWMAEPAPAAEAR